MIGTKSWNFPEFHRPSLSHQIFMTTLWGSVGQENELK
jgi:hypothetical protein